MTKTLDEQIAAISNAACLYLETADTADNEYNMHIYHCLLDARDNLMRMKKTGHKLTD